MSLISKIELLQYTQEDIENARKYFNTDAKAIKQSVEILRNWLKQQQHLPHVASDDFLERILLRNKFRIEQTKQKLDDYYTLRGLYPDYILKNFDIPPSKQVGQVLPLPKLTKSSERIIFAYKTNEDMDVLGYIAYVFTIMELILHNDYSVGDKFLLDFANMRLNDITGWTLARLSNVYKLYKKAFSGRISSIDIVNLPPHANFFITLFKLILPQKIHSRIIIHNDWESVYKSIPKEYLPSDFGGELESVTDLTNKLDKIYIQQRHFFEDNVKNVSQEKLRVGDIPRNELYGVEGNFKKLDID